MEQSEGTLPYGHREGFFLTFSMGFYPGCSEISWQICMERCSVSFLPVWICPVTIPQCGKQPALFPWKIREGNPGK